MQSKQGLRSTPRPLTLVAFGSPDGHYSISRRYTADDMQTVQSPGIYVH